MPRPLPAPRQGLTFSPGIVVAALLTVLIVAFAVYLGIQLVRFAKPPTLAVTSPVTAVVEVGEDTTAYTLAGTSMPRATITIQEAAREQPYRVSADATGALDRRRRAPPRTQRVHDQRDRPRDQQAVRADREGRSSRCRSSCSRRRRSRSTQPADGATVRERRDPGQGTTTNATTVAVSAVYRSGRRASRLRRTGARHRRRRSAPKTVKVAVRTARSDAARADRPGSGRSPSRRRPEGKTDDADPRRHRSATRASTSSSRSRAAAPGSRSGWTARSRRSPAAAGKVFSPGKVLTFTAKRAIEVRTGKSSATYFTLNGKDLGRMANKGNPETWRFEPRASRPDRDAAEVTVVGDPLVELAERLQAPVRRAGLTVATAESCTGGLVAHALTEVPGSCGVLRGRDRRVCERRQGGPARRAGGGPRRRTAPCQRPGRARDGRGRARALRRRPRRRGHRRRRPGRRHRREAGRARRTSRSRAIGGSRGAALPVARRPEREQARQRRRRARAAARARRGSAGGDACAGAPGDADPRRGGGRGGLAPARPARPIERRASGSTSSGRPGRARAAAALLAAGPGRPSTAATRAAPSPYTPALDAAGIHVAWPPRPGARHGAAAGRPTRLAVTKALTAIDPDHPELVAARAAGIPLEPWQQVVADAAARRTLVAVAGTHGKSTTAGWLVHVLASGGADPSAFVGALLPASLTGRARRRPRAGARGGVRRRGGRVRRQLRPVPARGRGPDLGRVGPPRRVRGPRRRSSRRSRPGSGAWRPWPGRRAAGPRRERRRRGRRRAGRRGSPTGRADRRRRARRRRAAARRRLSRAGSPSGSRTAAGPATALLGRITAADPDATDASRSQGLDPLAGPVTVAPADRRPPQRRERAGRRRRGARPLGLGAGRRSSRGWRRSRASAGGSSARARRRASSSTTTTATTRPRSARRSPRSASASPAGGYGRCTSR